MKSLRWFLSYILVSSLGLGAAFLVSVKFMAPAKSQNAPGMGDLPPEFMKEVESIQAPGPEKNTVPEKASSLPESQIKDETIPKASVANPTSEKIPPPPASVQGDGATTDATSSSDYLFRPNFSYDPTGRRDPFLPFRIIQNLSSDSPRREEKVLEPLQRFDIEKIKVIGIIWDVKKPRAMVKDPEGVVHTIVKDTKIGRNEGFVAAIREGEVVIIENKVENGKVVAVPNIMGLRK
jgi:type IV pilus assembly protein PilP